MGLKTLVPAKHGIGTSDYGRLPSSSSSHAAGFVDVEVLDPALDDDGRSPVNVAFVLILLTSAAAWGIVATTAVWLFWVLG